MYLLYTIGTGIGVWGLNKNIGWAWDITNFVWWVGIGHAGTLNFCRIIIIPSKMENGDQPFCRGDDDFRRSSGRFVPNYSHGTSMDRDIGYYLFLTNLDHCG